MTIEQIQADEALRLREFPVARETAYLAHAAVCPLPACARDAVSDYAAAGTGGDQENFVPANLLRDTRQLASNLLGAELCEIALVGPTSPGLSFIAQGIDWQRLRRLLRRRRPGEPGACSSCVTALRRSTDGPGLRA